MPSEEQISRINNLAQARKQNMYFLPDKPSVYWLDYIPDPTPHLITSPSELLDYYQTQWFTKFPRIEELAQPRPWPNRGDSRPSSQYGVSMSALNYVPSERIKILAEPHQRTDSSDDASLKLPPIENRRGKPDKDKWDWTRLPKTPMQRALQSSKSQSSSPSEDAMSKGDFPARSRMRRIVTRSSTQTNEQKRNPNYVRLPPVQQFQQGQGENQSPGYRGSDHRKK